MILVEAERNSGLRPNVQLSPRLDSLLTQHLLQTDYMMIAETIECLIEVKPLPLTGKWSDMTDEKTGPWTPETTALIDRLVTGETGTTLVETADQKEEAPKDSSGKGTEAMLEMTGETVFSGTDQTDETIGTVTDVGLELPPGTVDQSGSQRERDREAMTHGWLSGGQALAGITGREGALAPVCRMTETGHGSASLTILGQAFLVVHQVHKGIGAAALTGVR